MKTEAELKAIRKKVLTLDLDEFEELFDCYLECQPYDKKYQKLYHKFIWNISYLMIQKLEGYRPIKIMKKLIRYVKIGNKECFRHNEQLDKADKLTE